MPPGKYERKNKTKEEYIELFLSKVDKNGPNGCWLWQGPTNNKGYGQFSNNIIKSNAAHRFSYSIFVEPIKDGNVICHKCDNPPCVNPEHLFQGTHADNMQDAINKGRLDNIFKKQTKEKTLKKADMLRHEILDLEKEIENLKKENERMAAKLKMKTIDTKKEKREKKIEDRMLKMKLDSVSYYKEIISIYEEHIDKILNGCSYKRFVELLEAAKLKVKILRSTHDYDFYLD